MAGDGPKVTPEQLAMMDQLNQKLASGEVTAKAYAEAIKDGGLELAHQVRLLEQQIAKMDELLSKAQQANLDAKSYNTLMSQRVATAGELNNLQSTGNQLGKQGLKDRRDANAEATKLSAEAKKLQKEMEKANVWGQSFVMEIAKGELTLDKLGDKVSQLGSAIGQGAIDAITDSMILNFTAADNLQAGFNKMSGQAGAMNSTVMNAHRGVGSLGVSMEMTGAAANLLYQEFNQFSSMNSDLQTEMIQTTASLENVGIASGDTAQNIALASNGFGMTAKESVNLQNDLAKTAMAIGMPPAKLASEFKKAAPALAVYGKKGIEVFKNMAATSKGLGVEMGTLLGITEQFDTFEGAASAAGSLNAMLGGDLFNSMELLNATEDERIRMILQGVEASGKSWSAMGKFERKNLAATMGIKDMAEANALFAGGLKGYDDAQAKAAENAKTDADLAQAKQAAVSIMDKMKIMTQQLAVALGPLITGMHFLMDVILGVNDMFGGYLLPVLVGGIAVIYGVYKAMQFVIFAKKAMAVASAFAASGSLKERIANVQSTVSKQANAAACGALTTCTEINAAAKLANASANASETAATGAGTVAKNTDTVATNAGTAATQGGMLATMKSTAAKIWNRIQTIASAAWEKVLAAARWAQAAATSASTAALNLNIISMLKSGAAKAFELTKTVALVAWEKAMAIGRYVLAGATWLLAFAFGGQSTAQGAVAATAAPAATGTAAMGTASAAAAGPVLALGIGVGLLAIGIGLVAIAIAAIVWAFVYLIQLFMDAPGKALLAAGAMVVLGVAVAVLTGIFAALAPIAPIAAASMIILGTGMMALAPPMLLLSLAFMGFAMALSMMPGGAAVAMLGLAAAMIPFAIAMAIASPFLLFAGLFMAAAGVPFMLGAFMIAAGIGALALVAPSLGLIASNIVPAALALALAAPLLAIAGWAMLFGAFPFILGAGLMAVGMLMIAGPLQMFANAIATLGPFIPALPALASALLALGFALPIFGLGLFLLGVFASLPFFDTGLEVLTTALYTFADAMSTIPTEKAVALGQIFAGLSTMTDMDGIGSAMSDFAFGVMTLGWALSFMPEAESLQMMADGLKSFAETGAKHVLPVSIALYAAAPYLLGAAMLLAPAAFFLILAGLPLAIGMFWVATAFGYFGEASAKAGLETVKENFFGAALGLFFGAPMLFFASVWLFFAGPLFFIGALWLSAGMILLNEPLLQFVMVMTLLAPLAPLLPQLAHGLFLLGLALPVLGYGLFKLGFWASMPFFETGLSTLTRALYVFADAMSTIPTEKAVALGQIFTGLAAMADMDSMADAIYDTADAIWFLAWTMSQVPEESIWKMQAIFENGLAPMNELAKNMSPEVAVNAGKLVGEAERYMEVQAQMKSPQDDAFAQVMIENSKAQAARADADKAAAESGAGAGGGQDVVLVLNERELGRAVEVILNKRINLGVS